MARDMNSFALLGEDDEGDSDLLALAQSAAAKKPKAEKKSPTSDKLQAQSQPAKLPFKPPPPAEAVRAERGRGRGTGRGRGGGGGRGFGGGGGFNGGTFGSGGGRGSEGGGEFSNGFGGGRGGGRGFGEEDGGAAGGRRGRGRGRGRSGRGGGRFGGGPSDGDAFDGPPRRQFESDAPAGQWEAAEGSFVDEHKNMEPEVNKPQEELTQDIATENKEEKKEEEDKEMTLDEYEKLMNDKRKALEALKNEERKVPLDRDFESMQLVDKKKDVGIFIKVNSEKDKLKKKEVAEKDDKVRKAVSINEFLKPTDGEKFYTPPGTRGRGRGRGRGGGRGYGGTTRGAFTGFAGRYNDADEVAAPHIEDPVQFPVLAAK